MYERLWTIPLVGVVLSLVATFFALGTREFSVLTVALPFLALSAWLTWILGPHKPGRLSEKAWEIQQRGFRKLPGQYFVPPDSDSVDDAENV